MVALTGIFVASRAIFLDSDLPAWSVAQLQPIDEFFYAIPAFNLYHYGSMDHQVLPFIATDGAPVNLLETLMTWVTLVIFGNTYYGLRMASVVAGLLALLMVYAILRRQIRPSEGPDARWTEIAVPLLVVAYLVTDFAFNVAARAAEPTIFRLLAMCCVLYAVSRWREPSRLSGVRSLTLGALAGTAFVYVYVYNAFLVPAVVVAIFLEHLDRGLIRAVGHALLAGAGSLLAAVSYAVVVWFTYHETLVQIYQDNFKPFGGRILAAGLNGGIVSVTSTNIFRFDLALLVAFALAVPVFAYRLYRERDAFGFTVGAVLFFLVVQSVLVVDYQYRKLLMLDPLVVIVIGLAIGYVRPFINFVGAHRSALVALFLWLTLSEYNVYHVYQLERGALGRTFQLFDVACVGLLVATLLLAYVNRGQSYRALVGVGMAAIILPGIFVSIQELYVKPTYRYRDAMIAAAPMLDHKVSVGGYSLAFRLYNDSVPVLNDYQYEYRPGGPKQYTEALERAFAEGAGTIFVTDSKQPPPADLGLQRVAVYEIDVEETSAIAVYARP